MDCNELQETGRVVKHIEMWDVEPGKVLKRLIRPAARTPTSRWETLMLSVHEGDVKGIWLAASAPLLTVSGPVVGVSLLTKLVTGHGLPVSKQHYPVGEAALLQYCTWLLAFEHNVHAGNFSWGYRRIGLACSSCWDHYPSSTALQEHWWSMTKSGQVCML